MARYNAWQNQSVLDAADTLDDTARNLDRGAFFGSIRGTLSHLLWGDQIWLSRFSGSPAPAVSSIEASADMCGSWGELKQQRTATDQAISSWAQNLDATWLEDDLTWFSGAAKREVTKPAGFLVMHFFNHQTHHRGQVHAMLTAAGAKPDDTDLFFMRM
ncbi:DinB family protein [Anderseniella sp. Alg231-50]|uniref:DinB family protein n=1 Tax=Anderseniella sp. Alg231-50 TaxID=1922226 RepID=UPI000D55C51F